MAVFTGQGSAASPSITFSANTNTGIFSPGGDEIGISTGGTGRFFIDSIGNVGVGGIPLGTRLDVRAPLVTVRATSTTATNYALYLGTNSVGGLRLGVESSTGGSLLFGSSANSTILGSDTNHNLHLGTNSSTRLTIDTAGNVGIGTSTPGTNLHVVGTSLFNGTQSVVCNSTTGSYMTFQHNGTSVGDIGTGNQIITGGATTDFSLAPRNPGSLVFGGGGVERVRITAAGLVGIGTSTPSKQLDVVTAGSGNVRMQATTGNAVFTAESVASGAAILELVSSSGTQTIVGGLGSANNMVFSVNSIERARIDSNGFAKITGAIGRGAPVTKTANFSLGIAENWVICNGTGTITATLPAASSWTGREVMIKTIAAFTVISASSNVVPLAGGAAGTAILAATGGKYATLVSDGTNWIIMEAN